MYGHQLARDNTWYQHRCICCRNHELHTQGSFELAHQLLQSLDCSQLRFLPKRQRDTDYQPDAEESGLGESDLGESDHYAGSHDGPEKKAVTAEMVLYSVPAPDCPRKLLNRLQMEHLLPYLLSCGVEEATARVLETKDLRDVFLLVWESANFEAKWQVSCTFSARRHLHLFVLWSLLPILSTTYKQTIKLHILCTIHAGCCRYSVAQNSQ